MRARGWVCHQPRGRYIYDYDFLLARARQCEAERGKIPNFIAVDFYQNGDVLGVVDALNSVGAGTSADKVDSLPPEKVS